MNIRWMALAALSVLSGSSARAEPGVRDKANHVMNLAFVLLSEPTLPKSDNVERAYARFAGAGEHIHFGKSAKGKVGTVTVIDLAPHGTGFIALMPVAIPENEAEDAARHSLSALGKGWKPAAHKAHLVVSVTAANGERPLAALQRFTSLVAAITKSTPAVGVYWGGAGATHDPELFVETAAEPGIVPRITLWTGISVAAEGASRVSLLSLGMKQLELPDLMMTARKDDMANAMETFFDLLAYVADRGTPLPEGDTVGRTENEKLPVHYVASPIDGSKKVWRVDLK